MQYLSQLYDSKRLRGKAKEGYVRPTLREIFTADVFYEEIEKFNGIDPASVPNFTRSTEFAGAVGEDVIKVNDSLGVAPSDQGSEEWGCDGTELGSGCQSDTDGASNTSYILSNCGERPIPASVCANYGDGNWYLPAKTQLETLYNNEYNINIVADTIFQFESGAYWSSTEYNDSRAYTKSDSVGTFNSVKAYGYHMRCVRTF